MSKVVVSEDFPSIEKWRELWVFLDLYSSYLCSILNAIKVIFDKNIILRWYYLRALMLGKVDYSYTDLWIDIQKSEKTIGDLFTYCSFASLVLTCSGAVLGINITTITIMKVVGAVSTIGSVLLKVSSKISTVNTQSFQVSRRLDNMPTICASAD